MKEVRVHISILFLASLTVAACKQIPQKAQHDNSSRADEIFANAIAAVNCEPAFEVFEKRLHPQLKKNCAECHGRDQAPKFALNNSSKSLRYGFGVIDTKNPQASVLIERASDGHCKKSNCKSDKPEMTSAVVAVVQEISKCQPRSAATEALEQEAFEYFANELFPELIKKNKEHKSCTECHDSFWWAKAVDIVAEHPPQHLEDKDVQKSYVSLKQYLRADRETFHASPLYDIAAAPHFGSGRCNDDPEREQEEQSPCREIRRWWELENALQNQNPGL